MAAAIAVPLVALLVLAGAGFVLYRRCVDDLFCEPGMNHGVAHAGARRRRLCALPQVRLVGICLRGQQGSRFQPRLPQSPLPLPLCRRRAVQFLTGATLPRQTRQLRMAGPPRGVLQLPFLCALTPSALQTPASTNTGAPPLPRRRRQPKRLGLLRRAGTVAPTRPMAARLWPGGRCHFLQWEARCRVSECSMLFIVYNSVLFL